MKIRSSFILLGSCFVFLGASQAATACPCFPNGTVLEDFQRSDVVVIARLVSAEPIEPMPAYPSDKSAKMVVEKVFKGSVQINEELTFEQSDEVLGCAWSFHPEMIGKSYLLYLSQPAKPSDRWFVSTCMRSRSARSAGDDLSYLNNLSKVRGRTRISGEFEADGDEDLSVAGRKIRIIGRNKTYVATTNNDGLYELYDLPPGRYFVEPELPDGWRVEEFRQTRILKYSEWSLPAGNRVAFTLRPHKHFGINIMLTTRNEVSGAVYDSKGKPLESVCVSLIRSDLERPQACGDSTDNFGHFKIDYVEAGTYVLTFYRKNPWPIKLSLAELYYPGVTERAKAQTFTLKRGDSVQDLKLVFKT